MDGINGVFCIPLIFPNLSRYAVISHALIGSEDYPSMEDGSGSVLHTLAFLTETSWECSHSGLPTMYFHGDE
jgi:hypothetical protein